MRFIGISEERKTVGQRHYLKRQSLRLFWNWWNTAFIIRLYCRNTYWRWFVKIKEETSVVGNHTSISWLHPLIHSHSHLILSCCSTQDQLSLLYPLFPTVRSFSSEAFFHDYTVPSHIKYSAALLLPWALKKLPKVVSYPPVQIHLNDIFHFPTPLHCRNSEFCQTLYYGSLTFNPKTYSGEGWREYLLSSTLRTCTEPLLGIQVFTLSRFSLLNFLSSCRWRKNWFNLTVLFPIFSLMPKPVYLFLKGQTFDSLFSALLGHFFPEAMNATK